MLEILVLGNNQIEDTFPSWLRANPELQVLVLRSNKFHGSIGNHKTDVMFPKLRILDLSSNGFSGNLPSEYFENWKAMKMASGESSYDGNPGLCGVPLSTPCENPKASPPPLYSSQKDETGFTRGIYWMVIFMGYGSGLIVGLVIGTTLTQRYHEWFVETFGGKKKIQKKQKRKERRN
ncbi:hypothetical protein RHGRI_009773 [Rhododendron griersonianum]|uniref:Uncharacterized protein n=1 Tax=Rhododendron griersonianum TaxID=479676 RepID=A0AAV6KGS4_9ERIC|nr:hypothetical protein RHGRI_009773 [Rhododendron griersonianum]